MQIRTYPTIEWALKEMVTVVGDCWLWTGTAPWSSGHCYIDLGRRIPVHVWFYEHFVKRVSLKNHLHHTCPNKNCIRWTHVKELTPSEHAKETKFWLESSGNQKIPGSRSQRQNA